MFFLTLHGRRRYTNLWRREQRPLRSSRPRPFAVATYPPGSLSRWIRWPFRTSLGMASVLVAAGLASAAEVRLQRILLLPVADRSSVVLELTAEPQQISTRRISDSVFEVEAGPGIAGAVSQTLKAPPNVRFVDSVTVRVMPTPAGPVVRARIMLTSAAQAMVRSSGRRVYVDISPATTQSPPVAAVSSVAAVAAPRAAAPVDKASTPARPTVEEAYRSGVRPVLTKLKELAPFAMSAAGGDPSVTTALLPTLATMRASLAALEPPDAARGSHATVLAAVDRIIRSLAPDYTGDRTTSVRQSMTTIEVVGEVLGE